MSRREDLMRVSDTVNTSFISWYRNSSDMKVQTTRDYLHITRSMRDKQSSVPKFVEAHSYRIRANKIKRGRFQKNDVRKLSIFPKIMASITSRKKQPRCILLLMAYCFSKRLLVLLS